MGIGRAAVVSAIALAAVGCVGPLSQDLSSVSLGWHAAGELRHPARLPVAGDGYRVGEPWRRRESQYATDEVVEAIVRMARGVARAADTKGGGGGGSVDGGALAPLAIGDLSRKNGGGSVEHRSHQSGRDFDVFFPAIDGQGRSAAPPGDTMIHFDRAGRAVRWSPPFGTVAPAAPVPGLRLDTRRAWRIVRALLEDPGVEVQWIFVQRDLATSILAQASGPAEAAVAARAAFLVRQPSDSEPHDDHMHVRVFCDPADRALGCADHGPVRWWKKGWKLMSPPFDVAREPDLGSALARILEAGVPIDRVDPPSSS